MRTAIVTILTLLSIAACGSSNTDAASTSGTTPTNANADGGGDGGGNGNGGGSGNGNGSGSGTEGSASDGGTTPVAAGACATRGGMRGLTSRKVTVGGLARTYLVYLPPALDPTKPVPLVYVFHGYTMSGQQMHDITQYETLADSEGIALAFPDGQGGADSLDYPWNVEKSGQTLCGAGEGISAAGDDFAFMDAMKSDITSDQCLDAAHVYASGFSMGGYFSHHIGCYRNDIRAVAPHSGGVFADLSSCITGHVPIIMFHGAADSVISPGCDDPHSTAVPGFPASAMLWAAKNGCKTTATAVTTNGAGGGKGTCYVYDGCPADGQVEVCSFAGMDHCWAGGSTSGAGASSACPTYASATELEWSFFKKYAW
jgi:polyhydroxybutyrate depolymerase